MIHWQQFLNTPERYSKPDHSSRETAARAEDIPRCGQKDGTTLRIVPSDTQAGWFSEANALTVTDGERTAIYVPSKAVAAPDEDTGNR